MSRTHAKRKCRWPTHVTVVAVLLLVLYPLSLGPVWGSLVSMFGSEESPLWVDIGNAPQWLESTVDCVYWPLLRVLDATQKLDVKPTNIVVYWYVDYVHWWVG